jgi:hypothetical protein
MRVTHCLVGYDRDTDQPRERLDIPDDLLEDAKRIAQVPGDDPDAAWSYPLSEAQARSLAKLIGAELDPGAAEFFLEAFADHVSTGAAH